MKETKSYDYYSFINYVDNLVKNDNKISLEELKEAEKIASKFKDKDIIDPTFPKRHLISIVDTHGTKEAKRYYKLEINLKLDEITDVIKIENKDLKKILSDKKTLKYDDLKEFTDEYREATLEILKQAVLYFQNDSLKSRAGFNKSSQMAKQIKLFLDEK